MYTQVDYCDGLYTSIRWETETSIGTLAERNPFTCRPQVFYSSQKSLYLLLSSSMCFLQSWAQTSITVLPGANIQAAVDSNPANTTFVLQPGTYRLQSVQPKSGDSFIGVGQPLLSGAQILTAFTKVGNLYVAGGQTQQGQLNGVCDSVHLQCIYPEDLYFDSIPLLHAGSISSRGVPGIRYFDYPSHNIYFADNPTGHVVEASVTRSAFWGPASNVTISGLVIEKYAVPAQFGAIGDQYPGPNWIITNNEVRWNHGAGINLTSGSQATLNYVHHNGQKGLAAAAQTCACSRK